MLTLTGATKPFIAQSIEELLHHIEHVLIPSGCMYWVKIHTPDDVDEFDRKIINTIEKERWKACGEHFPEIKFARFDCTCILMCKEIPFQLIDPTEVRDIRQTPLEISGFRVRHYSHDGKPRGTIEEIDDEMFSWEFPADPDPPQ